jgi:hypothetical protein
MLARSVNLPGDRNQDEALADSRMRHLAGGSTLALAHLLDIIGNGKIIPPTNPRAARQRLRVSLSIDGDLAADLAEMMVHGGGIADRHDQRRRFAL